MSAELSLGQFPRLNFLGGMAMFTGVSIRRVLWGIGLAVCFSSAQAHAQSGPAAGQRLPIRNATGNDAQRVYKNCAEVWNEYDYPSKPDQKALVGGTKGDSFWGWKSNCYGRWGEASVADAIKNATDQCRAGGFEKCFTVAEGSNLVPWAVDQMNASMPSQRQAGSGFHMPGIGALVRGFAIGVGVTSEIAGAATGRQDLVQNGGNLVNQAIVAGSGDTTGASSYVPYSPPPPSSSGANTDVARAKAIGEQCVAKGMAVYPINGQNRAQMAAGCAYYCDWKALGKAQFYQLYQESQKRANDLCDLRLPNAATCNTIDVSRCY